MAKQENKDELRRILAQMKKEERAESAGQSAGKRKQSEAKKQTGREGRSLQHTQRNHGGKKQSRQQTGLKQQLINGLPAMLIDTVLLYVGTYIFSLLYKTFVKYEFSTGTDITYYVSPATGFFGILLLFVLKNVYDIRFYRIQLWAKETRQKWIRVGEWIAYVFFMFFLEMISFICFSCGNNFFDTYTFENAVFGNMAYTLLYVIIPLLYPIQAIVRLIFRKAERRDAM